MMKSDSGVTIFRGADAPTLVEAGCEITVPFTDLQQAGIDKMVEAGFTDGYEVNVLVNIPGFSLVLLWFKQNFPLPLHSHDVDCLYFIVAGSLKLGTETLGPRDSFLIQANVPYSYHAGENGVEVLEIRHANQFEFRNLAKSMAFYDKAVETIRANRKAWQCASRLSDSA